MYKYVSTKAIKFLFSVLVFFTPLIFVSNTKELFEFPKMIFVYALGTTIIWLFLIKKIYLREKFQKPNILIILFLLGYILSTVFSMHPYTSIWGYYSRFNGGLVSLTIFLGLYFVLINEFTTSEIRYLAVIAVVSLIPIGLLTLFQHYEFIANIWKIDTTQRAVATFGQPNWLAAYVTMLIPISLGFTFGSFEKYEAASKNKFWWLLVFLLGFVAMWFSQSVSGILGYLGGLLAFYHLNKNKLILYADSLAILMIFCLAFALLNPGIFKERLHDLYIDLLRIAKVYAISEEKELQGEYTISDPGYIRHNLWESTTKLITSSPKITLIGTGPETFPYAYQPFRSEKLNYSSEWEFVFNKPHNYYLELFSNIGMVGLTLYFFIVVKSLAAKNPFYTPGLVALYITNIFGWPTVATTLLFWIFIAGIEKEI